MTRLRSEVRYEPLEIVTELASDGHVERRSYLTMVPYVYFGLEPVGTTEPEPPKEQANE